MTEKILTFVLGILKDIICKPLVASSLENSRSVYKVERSMSASFFVLCAGCGVCVWVCVTKDQLNYLFLLLFMILSMARLVPKTEAHWLATITRLD